MNEDAKEGSWLATIVLELLLAGDIYAVWEGAFWPFILCFAGIILMLLIIKIFDSNENECDLSQKDESNQP